jgi:hypothetical protein
MSMQHKTRGWLVWGSVSALAVAALVAVWLVFAAAPDAPLSSGSSTASVQAKQDQPPAGSRRSAPSSDAVAALPPSSTGAGATQPGSGGAPGSNFGRPTADHEAALPGQSPISRPDDRTGAGRPSDKADEAGGGGAHQLTDRTGRGGNLAAQLNKELMPLVAECIELARERNPRLSGMLSFAVNLVPIDDSKVLVGSVELQKDNEIDDPELFECIEQSTLSIEGLETPESFAITMPLTPDDTD